jgi:hypothetical protein
MLLRALAFASLLAPLAAQTPPCLSNNDANNASSQNITLVPFTGPNVYAYRITPASSTVLFGARLYTASSLSTSGYMTLEIWTENPATSLPGARIAGGTLQTSNALGTAWLGANFDGAAPLIAATNYWLVWREPGGSRLPYESGGVTLPFARFTGGNWVLQASQQPLKWRGFCAPLDDVGLAAVGQSCASSQGFFPASFANQAPTVGNANFQFEATGFLPGTIGLAVVGANPSWVPFPIPGAPAGCVLNVDPMVVGTVSIGAGNQQAAHSVGAAGHCWLDLPIPANPALVGFAIDAQFAGVDVAAAASLPFVFSSGLRATIY